MTEEVERDSRFAASLKAALKSVAFSIDGELPQIENGIEIAGIGALRFPLTDDDVKLITAVGHPSPYGQGTETIVDSEVRNSIELDRSQFLLSDAWNAAVAEVLPKIAEELGLPEARLEATPHKLLIYEVGGFFLPHRDSEKQDRMVATLVVILPNPFSGGSLEVRHNHELCSYDASSQSNNFPVRYVAFYADCEHQVTHVESGVRMSLEYSLTLKQDDLPHPVPQEVSHPIELVRNTMKVWFEKRPLDPLVLALEHEYTESGLQVDLLKGNDRSLAQSVIIASQKADYHIHFARLTRVVLTSVDEEDEERDSSEDGSVGDKLEKDRVILNDEWKGSHWRELSNTPRAYGTLAFVPSAVVVPFAREHWNAASSEYKPFLGNQGAGIEKWYHRSAIAVWPREQHQCVLLESGFTNCIEPFCEMASHLPNDREGCIRFARLMLKARYDHEGYDDNLPLIYHNEQLSKLEKFRDQLLTLNDSKVVKAFLQTEATSYVRTRLTTFVRDASRQFGYDEFARLLLKILKGNDDRNRIAPAFDVFEAEWLFELCFDRKGATRKENSWLSKLCVRAVKQFCDKACWRSLRDLSVYYGSSEKPAELATMLLKSLACIGHDQAMNYVVNFLVHNSNKLSITQVHIESLNRLIPWCQNHLLRVPSPLTQWSQLVQEKLGSTLHDS